jgi:tetratricopeptide (TPR) repeat protein
VYLAQSRGGALQALELPPEARVANALTAAATYLAKAIWPAGLAVFYPHPGASIHWLKAATAGVVLVAATFVVIRASARRPHFAFGWLWFLVTLAPASGLVQVGWQAMADRYTYIPYTGLFIAAAWGLGELADAASRPAARAGAALPAVAAVAAVVALAAASSIQTRSWKNSITLFEHAREVAGGNWLAEYSLGNEFWRLGRKGDAQERFRTAIRLNPAAANAYNNLGALLLLEGKTAEALPLLTEAARLSPRDPALRFNLGLALEKEGNPEAASSHYREALRLKPEYPEARIRLEIALRKPPTPYLKR